MWIGGIGDWCSGIGDRFADRDVTQASQADDIPGRGLLDVDAPEAVEGKQLGHPGLLHVAVELGDSDLVADFHAAVEEAPDRDTAQVIARVEVWRREAGAARPDRQSGRADMLDDRVEQRTESSRQADHASVVAVPSLALA